MTRIRKRSILSVSRAVARRGLLKIEAVFSFLLSFFSMQKRYFSASALPVPAAVSSMYARPMGLILKPCIGVLTV